MILKKAVAIFIIENFQSLNPSMVSKYKKTNTKFLLSDAKLSVQRIVKSASKRTDFHLDATQEVAVVSRGSSTRVTTGVGTGMDLLCRKDSVRLLSQIISRL